MREPIYGTCECGGWLHPVRFIEKEMDRNHGLTGRVRDAVSHLVCDDCLKNVCVDDTFDGPWYFPNRV